MSDAIAPTPPATTLRTDALSLIKMFSTVSNKATGLGTARDKTQYTEINHKVRSLNEAELSGLYRKSNIIQRAVSTYPLDAIQSWIKLQMGESKLVGEDIEEYFSDERLPVSLKSAVYEASLQSRWHGDGFLLLGIVDGREPQEPVDLGNIQSLRWIKHLTRYEIRSVRTRSHHWTNPEFYELILDKESIEDVAEIEEFDNYRVWHKSRVVRVSGVTLDKYGLMNNDGCNDSIIQSMYESFCSYMPGLMAASIMVQDHRVRRYGIKGLANLVEQSKNGATERTNQNGKDLVESILERVIANDIARSVAKSEVFDPATEEIDNLTNQYNGVDGVINQLFEFWTMNTDMSRLILYNLLGSNSLASGEAFKFARLDHGYRLNSWMENKLRSPLTYIYKIGMLAKDAPTKGAIAKRWKLEIPILFKMTQEEKIALQESAARRDTTYIGLGVYSASEARKQFTTAEFDPNLTFEPGSLSPAEIKEAKEEEQRAQQAQQAQQASDLGL